MKTPVTSVEPAPMTELDCAQWIDLPYEPRFAYASADLEESAQQELARGADALVKRIAKHQDILQIRIHGLAHWGEPNPQELSMSRAEAVRDELIGGGVPAKLLEVHAYGGSRPGIEALDVDYKTTWRRVNFRMLLKGRLGSGEECGGAPQCCL